MSRHKKAGLISSYNTVHLHRTCNSSSFSCWRKGHGVRSSRAQTWGVGFDPRHPCSPNASPSTCPATGLKKRCWWEEFYARTLFVHNCKIVTIPRRFRGARQHSVLVLFWPCDRVKMQQHYWNWMRGAPFLLRSCCSLVPSLVGTEYIDFLVGFSFLSFETQDCILWRIVGNWQEKVTSTFL